MPTITLIWSTVEAEGQPTERVAEIPIPDGHYLAWSCVNETDGTVTYQTAPIPEPLPDPEPDPGLPE